MFSENKESKDFLNNFISFLNENNKSKVNYNCYEELLEKFNDKKDFLVDKKLQIDLRKFLFEEKFRNGESNLISEKSINNFLLIEDSIDNIELFWILFGNIVLRDRFSSNRLNDYKKIIFKKNRLSIGLYIRSLLANLSFVNLNKNKLVFGGIKKLLEKELLFFWNSYFENIEEENEIILFRGFILNKGKIIRNSKIKDKQLEGLGICYSVDREVAISFATTLNPYLNLIYNLFKSFNDEEKKLFNLDKKFRIKLIGKCKTLLKEVILQKQEVFSKQLLDHKPYIIQNDCRSIVGKYKIKKKDIIIISNNTVSLSGVVINEQQVICFPEFVSLKRYDYVNHNEFVKINSQIKTEDQLIKLFSKK